MLGAGSRKNALTPRAFCTGYAANFIDQHRLAAGYVDRLFKGTKPANLPAQARRPSLNWPSISRPWALKHLPIDYKPCCIDRLNPPSKADSQPEIDLGCFDHTFSCGEGLG
jgi:hypothetical protein